MRTPLDADLSQHICGTRTLTGTLDWKRTQHV